MNPPLLPRIAAFLVLVGAGAGRLLAQDGIEELAKARDLFEKEMSFSTRPIRDRYLSRLEAMKRSLGSRGDARAAAAVQDEIDRVNAMNQETASVVRFSGTWDLTYNNGSSRRYSIAADGTVSWQEAGGKLVSPVIKSKLTAKNSDFIAEWSDGSLERFKLIPAGLVIEHFNPKTSYPSGQPAARGVGKLVTRQ